MKALLSEMAEEDLGAEFDRVEGVAGVRKNLFGEEESLSYKDAGGWEPESSNNRDGGGLTWGGVLPPFGRDAGEVPEVHGSVVPCSVGDEDSNESASITPEAGDGDPLDSENSDEDMGNEEPAPIPGPTAGDEGCRCNCGEELGVLQRQMGSLMGIVCLLLAEKELESWEEQR